MKRFLTLFLFTLILLTLTYPGINLAVGTAANPILVVASTSGYGTFTGEILKTEGFNEYQIESLADAGLTLSYLNNYQIVILTEAALTSAQATMFRDYVSGGGNLIAFRPDKQLASVFGISDAGGTVSEGYLQIDTAAEIGRGLVPDTLQFHNISDRYNLNGGTKIATLFTNATTSTGQPAVVSNNYGSGHAAAFTYNLPKSIVYTRQGNPDMKGLERDGINGIRAADMFVGWVNSSKNHLNQADEQMRLISHIIEKFDSYQKPLPRFWYFPDLNKSLITLTDDGEDSTEADFNAHLADIESKGARITVYLKSPYIPAATVANWVSRGHEISGDVDDTNEATNPTFNGMDSKVNTAVTGMKSTYNIDMRSVRNHWIVWYGWADQPQIELNHGIEFDCNVYHFDNGSTQGHFLGPVGNFTGSGFPMKFDDWNGNVINIYQSLTQLPDEQWGQGNLYNSFKTLLDRSLDQEGYTYLNVNFHTDRWAPWSRTEGLQIMDYANSRGVPMWTAKRTLDFLKMKDAASFKSLAWSANKLTFQLNAPVSGSGLTFMVPKVYNGLNLISIKKDGTTQSFTSRTIKGTDYALVATASGGTYNIEAAYQSGGPTPTPTPTPAATPTPVPGGSENMFGSKTGTSYNETVAYELGVIFQTSAAGQITGIRVYAVTNDTGDHTARIWRNSDNAVIGGPYTINYSGANAWVTYNLPSTVSIAAGTQYTVSVTTGAGTTKYYASISGDLTNAGNNGNHLSWPANAGVYGTTLGSRPTSVWNGSNYLRDIEFTTGERDRHSDPDARCHTYPDPGIDPDTGWIIVYRLQSDRQYQQ